MTSHRLNWVAVVAAAALLAPAAADATTAKSKRTKPADRPAPRLYDDRDRFKWYPRDADQLKIGSRIWFDQMEAEGRFGGVRRESN